MPRQTKVLADLQSRLRAYLLKAITQPNFKYVDYTKYAYQCKSRHFDRGFKTRSDRRREHRRLYKAILMDIAVTPVEQIAQQRAITLLHVSFQLCKCYRLSFFSTHDWEQDMKITIAETQDSEKESNPKKRKLTDN